MANDSSHFRSELRRRNNFWKINLEHLKNSPDAIIDTLDLLTQTSLPVYASCGWQKLFHPSDLLRYKEPLHEILNFHLLSCCGNFRKTHSFCRALGNLLKTLWKLLVSTKFPHQESWWTYGLLCNELSPECKS